MIVSSRNCPACESPVPEGANYCPGCGAATPTAISRETGEVVAERASDTSEIAHREHLQLALGDGYEVGDLLGRGGFAEVYAARDVRLKREVAVKTLRYDLNPTPVLLQRFQREAEAMARLRHPHLMPVYSVGEGEGLAYFVMPLVKGETLRAVLERERRLPLAEVRRIVVQTASALDQAHRVGMVHRDIKPDNIILEGEERRVLVMDLGIAKAAEASGPELTGTGVIIGTPHYMSPEQASGERVVDHRADIYALGVVAFQMIAGELPFTAPSVQGVIIKHISEEAPPVTRFRPECPADLARAVARCLAKGPEQRFESAEALCETLESTVPGGVAGRVDTGARRSSGVAAVLRPGPDPVARFRASLVIYLVGSAVLLAVDLATNRAIDFAPVVIVVALLPVASLYAKLWMEGRTWRDVLGRVASRSAMPGKVPSWTTGAHATPPDSGAFGAHASVVNRVRSERAVLAGLVARMPKVQRSTVADVVPAADGLVARVRALARQLARLDRVVEEKAERFDTTSGVIRLRQDLSEAEARREAVGRELEAAEVVIQDLRGALERALAMGVGESRTDLEVAVENVKARARGG